MERVYDNDMTIYNTVSLEALWRAHPDRGDEQRNMHLIGLPDTPTEQVTCRLETVIPDPYSPDIFMARGIVTSLAWVPGMTQAEKDAWKRRTHIAIIHAPHPQGHTYGTFYLGGPHEVEWALKRHKEDIPLWARVDRIVGRLLGDTSSMP